MKTLKIGIAALLIACGGTSVETDKLQSTECTGDIAVGEVQDFAAIGEPTEGIAFGPDGRLYVAAGNSGTIWALTPDGKKTKVTTLEAALGIAFKGDDLFIAGLGADKVFKVDSKGQGSEYAAPVTKPNFVTATPWGTILVSNDFSNTIHEVTEGKAVLWSEAVSSPNGMVFDEAGENLFAVTTFETDPGLWRLPVSGKKAGKPALVARFAGYPTPDGIAMDSEGSLYVALNVTGEIVKVDPETGEMETVADKLTFPASLAFGQGEFDRCSVYVTQLFGKGIHRIGVGKTGAKLF